MGSNPTPSAIFTRKFSFAVDGGLISGGIVETLATMCIDAPQNSLFILLVEDHADTAQAIGSFLVTIGHRVRTADSVEAAIKNVINHRFDLIISDVGLPDGNGVSLMHGIRPFCNTPAIALTGFGGEDDVARCKRAGFDLHLTKPVGPKALEAAIKSVLSNRN